MWKSNRISVKNVEIITKSDSNFAPTFVDRHVLPDINFNEHCLISNNISIPTKVINICISYILNQWPRDSNTDFTLGSCFFGYVKLNKNADLEKYKYSSYAMQFVSSLEFSFTNGRIGKNVIILWADMSSSVNIDNKNKDILNKYNKYPIKFTQPRKIFVLSLHCNGSNSFLFVNATKIY